MKNKWQALWYFFLLIEIFSIPLVECSEAAQAKTAPGNVVKKQKSCSACHDKDILGEATIKNKKCLECHGSLEKLTDKTAPKDFPDRNPHKSHLGEINCTVCHTAHAESKVYCLECHPKFEMKLK